MKKGITLFVMLLMVIVLTTTVLLACTEEETGVNGTSVLTGNGVPQNDKGVIGDSYIDLDSWNFYVKANDGWTLEGNIKGEKGDAGSNAAGSADHSGTEGLEFYPLNDSECAVAVGTAKLLTEIVIPSTYKNYTVTTILAGDESTGGFSQCTNLTSIVIPDSVTSIGSYAFRGCSSLTSVVISDSVTSIGEGAFSGCYKLVEVYNLSALSIRAGSSNNGDVGYYAKNIYTSLDTPSKLSTDSNGYVIYADRTDKILVGYTGSETELVLPDGITEIYKYAFEYCSSLTSVVIPNSVTRIGDEAFSDCGGLTSIVIPDSVTSIEGYAFSDCSSLTIYCEAESEPSGWDYWWNCEGRPVVWGYEG